MTTEVVVDFVARNTRYIPAARQVIGTTEQVERTINRVAKASVAAGTAVVGSYGLMAKRGTVPFDREIRNTNSLIHLSGKELKSFSEDILNLATDVPQSATKLAQGAYNIASSGFTQTAEIEHLLHRSSVAAVAGITNTDVSAKALVTTLNAYNLSASHADRVSDVLFQTVNRGQLTFEQLAINLGDFIGVARAGGASMEETFAAYANITIATGQAHRAATSVQAIFRSMLNPTEELTAVTKELGFETTKVAIQEKGLEGYLRMVTNAVGGNEQALFKLFGTVEAVTGVLALQAFSEQQAAENLSYFTEKAKLAGVTELTFAEQSKAVGATMDQAAAAAGVAAIEFGSTFTPAIKAASDVTIMAVKAWRELPEPIREVIRLSGLFGGGVLAAAGITALFYGKIQLVRIALGFLQRHGILAWLSSYVQSTSLGSAATQLMANRVALLRTQINGAALSMAKGATVVGLFAMGAEQLSRSLHPEKVREMREALDNFASSDAFTGQLEEAFGDLEGLAKKIDDVYDLSRGTAILGFLNPAGSSDPFKLGKGAKAIDDLDEALVRLVENGQGERAKKIFDDLSSSLLRNGNNQDQVNEAFNDYRAAVSEAEFATRGAAASQFNMATSGQVLDESLYSNIQVAGAAERAFRNLSDAQRSFAESLASPAGSLDPIFSTIIERRRVQHDEQKDQNKGRSALERAHDIAQATIGITRAQYRLIDSQREYNRLLREGNAAEVSEAEERLYSVRNNLEEATGRLQAAEKSLKEARKGPTTRDLRELEMDLERARDRQAEVTEELAYAEEKLAAAQDHGTAEELVESERELREVRRQVEEAAWGAEDAEKALSDARKGPDPTTIQEAEKEVERARRDVTSATKEVGKAEEDLATARSGEEYAKALRDAEMDLQEAILGVQGAHLQLANAQKEEGSQGQQKFREEQEKTKVSLTDVMTELETQITAYQNWSDNILEIAERFGPAVASVLAKMGMDGARVVDELANATGADAERMAGDLEKWAVLGSKAFNSAIVQNLGMAKENARQLTKEQIEAIAEELGTGYPTALAWVQKYVGDVEATAKAHLKEVGEGKFRLYVPGQGFVGAVMEEEGGILNAPGHESHVAQIAPAGAWRMWAEPETGGEAYIPLAYSKRRRSENTLSEVAKIFGYDLHKMADGGVFPPIPLPPSFRDYLAKGMHSIMAYRGAGVSRSVYEEAMKNRAAAFPPAPDGGAVGDIVAAGRYFQSLGFRVGEHPMFGGVDPVHVPNSYHYKNRAIDVNWSPAQEEPAKLDALVGWIRQNLKYVELLWRTKGHYNHMHLAMSEGGILNSGVFDTGGWLQPGYTLAYNGTGQPEPVGYGFGSFSLSIPMDIDISMASDIDMRKAAQMVGEEVGKKVKEATEDLEHRVMGRVGSRRR